LAVEGVSETGFVLQKDLEVVSNHYVMLESFRWYYWKRGFFVEDT